jgi:hypothetical protein
MKKRMDDNNTADNMTSGSSDMNGSNEDYSNSNSSNNNMISSNSKPKTARPRTTRVKPGRLNTDAINPEFITTVDDWVSYFERGNVQLGPDGTLQVLDPEGGIKTIPFQKGFDAVRGITMRLEILRNKSTDFLANLRQLRQRELGNLEEIFVQKEKELLEATQHYRENPQDEELAALVVKRNSELSEIHKEIQQVKYPIQEPVLLYPFQRGVIQPGTHDESIIMINQPTNMESNAVMRTLGLDGEKLVPAVNNNEIEESDTDEDNGNEESSEIDNDSPTSESSKNSEAYFDELVDELKTKLKTFTIPESMTMGQLKSTLFTEERLEYYRTHIEDFNKQMRMAYMKAVSTEEDTA